MKNSKLKLWAIESVGRDGELGWAMNANGGPRLFERREDARNAVVLLGGKVRRVEVQIRREY